MHVGGSRRRTDFPEAERRICDLLRPRLVADGLYFVGVDLVGDKILEINVFTPGGLSHMASMYRTDFADRVVQAVEAKLAMRRSYGDAISNRALATL